MMFGQWRRLAASFCLVTYLLTNTPAVFALDLRFWSDAFLPRTSATDPVSAASSAPASKTPPRKCTRCCCAVTSSRPVQTRAALPKYGSTLNSTGTREHSRPACPCCPSQPSKPDCPVPGGCAFCSVAKIPLMNSPLTGSTPVIFAEMVLPERTSFPLLMPVGKLFRPPRV